MIAMEMFINARYAVMALVAVMVCTGSLQAQYTSSSDPGAHEDAAIERKKILKAADQVDDLVTQVNQLQNDVKSLREELSLLRLDNQMLKQQLSQSEAQRAKERDAILTEVSKQVEKSNKQVIDAATLAAERRTAEERAAREKEKTSKPTATPPSNAEKQEGYEHVVEAGQTLWLIAKAYRDKGVNVSVDDIRKANDLKPGDSIHKGQKLFIPQK